MKISGFAAHAIGMATVAAILGGCSTSGSQLAPSAPLLPSSVASSGSTRLGGARPNTAPTWWVYDYNRSGKELRRKRASVSAGVASFTFVPAVFTALLTTSKKSLTGNLTGKTLTDTVTVSGASGSSAFVTQHGGGCGNPPAVRFYFRTPGFAYTHFWWSNPESYVLANGTATLTAPLSDPSQWSDYNGKFGNQNPAAFAKAVAKVSQVGLSYGGDCFFENGATVTSGSALFESQFSES